MSFKRIEVLGFKSFADKLSIEFSDGITAIVGPNGCGKSNFADAIRWVLGEQAPKNLRGASMQDVIFKGAEGRKGLSYCEVSLVFSNEDKRFNLDYDEVVISRKLYRSGTSEYSLNRNPCLLKDIRNLLHDSGIGRDGYSIIGQGKVEQIVSSKPEDRRSIFEEAAGIAKFKERKNEAENKLARTRENLALIENTVIEIERQVLPMREQAVKAKKYLELRDNLKYLEINNYIYNFENASQNKQKIADVIDGLKEDVANKETCVAQATKNLNESLEGIKAMDEQIQAMNDEVLRLTVSLEKVAGDRRVNEERLKYLTEQNTKIEAELLEQRTDFDKINEQIVTLQANKSEKLNKLGELRAKCDELQNLYAQVLEQTKANEKMVSGAQQEVQSAIDKISEVKSNIAKLSTEIAGIDEQLNELGERQSGLNERKDGAYVLLKQAKLVSQDAEKTRQQAWHNLSALRTNLNSLEEGIRDAQEKFETANTELNRLESRNKILQEMQDDYEGYNNTVRRLLLDAGKNSELNALIVGVVGELITVPQQLEVAIEMALGFAVQNVVTRNEQDAKRLVQYLKSRNYGRATFLPINSVKPKFINPNYADLVSAYGSFGLASELIDYPSDIKPVIDSLLGNTIVVENMDTAIRLARESKFGFKIVTLDGDVLNTGGSIAGGSKKAEVNNLLSREREIETIAEKIKIQQSHVNEFKNGVTKYKEMRDELVAEIEKQSKILHDSDVELAQKEEILRHAQDDCENYELELESVGQEIARLSARKSALSKELELYNEINGADLPQVKDGGEKATSKSQYDILCAKRDDLNEQITEQKISIATLESELAGFDGELERLLVEQETLSQEIDENNGLLSKNNVTIDTTRKMTSGDGEGDYDATSNKLEAVKGKISEMETVKDELHDSIAGIEEERTKLNGELTRLNEKIFHEEARLAQIDTNIENMQDRILEDYELTYLTALEFKDQNFDPTNCNARINEIRREINKLGNVNVNAIEDSKALDERYGELSTQLADLKQAETDVVGVIKELSDQMTERFMTQFDRINQNFGKIFRELFGGGSAELKLTDGDVLTAGVEIKAVPPGKALGGNLSLLSGGEKSLTAIAILFSILKLRPMPFCLLDEIDAALDDANVERFAKYLHRFASETQFIVITHRKPTMELADNLYGVTMENKGVSKVVSVKLSEAIQTVH